jgi:hypothetical protein
MSIPWPAGLPMTEKNLKVYGRAIKKLSRKCSCQYHELIKHIDPRGAVHNRNCRRSDFYRAKQVDDKQLKWQGYKPINKKEFKELTGEDPEDVLGNDYDFVFEDEDTNPFRGER